MTQAELACIRCDTRYPATHFATQCGRCGPYLPSALTVAYTTNSLEGVSRESVSRGPRSIWRYDHSLPVEASHAISLGEGLTPLIRMDKIGGELGLSNLYGKCEFANPTGSFKDRLASSAISAAVTLFGAKVIASSSTGNAGAAAAAYAAKAGLNCIIFTAGATTGPMISQMLAYGATVVSVPSKPDRWRLIKEGVERFGWFPTSPFFGPPIGSNPFGVEGYKSLAYEMCKDLDWRVPDWVVLPVCYGDALFGMFKGFAELNALGWVDRMPRFAAAEIYGSLAEALETGAETPPEMPQPYQTAAASVTSPQGTFQSLTVLRKTGGRAVRAGEDELGDYRRRVARSEGIYLETAAAANFVAVEKLVRAGVIAERDTVVCLLTAGGLKEVRSQEEPGNQVLCVQPDMQHVLRTVAAAHGKDLSSPTSPGEVRSQ